MNISAIYEFMVHAIISFVFGMVLAFTFFTIGLWCRTFHFWVRGKVRQIMNQKKKNEEE